MAKKLFILNIDIGDNQLEKLSFREGDIPEEVAFLFCQEYALDTKAYEFIVQTLRQKNKIINEDLSEDEQDLEEDHNQKQKFPENFDEDLYESNFEDLKFDEVLQNPTKVLPKSWKGNFNF